MTMHAGARDQSLATPWTWIERVEHALSWVFSLDVCAADDTAKAPRWFTEADDGLRQPWDGVCWCNPPFNDIGSWVAKGLREVELGRARVVVYIVPANRSDQGWWQALRAMERRGEAWSAYPACRIAYLGGPSTPPFPSMFWAIGEAAIASRIQRLDGMPAQADLFAGVVAS